MKALKTGSGLEESLLIRILFCKICVNLLTRIRHTDGSTYDIEMFRNEQVLL
jgi:hypothetical protein